MINVKFAKISKTVLKMDYIGPSNLYDLMNKALSILFLFLVCSMFAHAQKRIMVIDYNNNESSDQLANGSQIYNRLVDVSRSIVRVNRIPKIIDRNKIDQVWLFGSMSRANINNLEPIVDFLNKDGSVYVQSEVNCCNEVASYVETLIHRVVKGGTRIIHKENTKGPRILKFNYKISCGEEVPGCAARKFEGVPSKNILLKVAPECGLTRDEFDDVFGVFFSSCDMISGRGALISIGDFNVFPSNTNCDICTPIGSSNSFVVTDKIISLFPYLINCSDFEDFVPRLNLGRDTSICIGETIDLDATTTDGRYRWNNFSRDPKITVEKDGEYWVELRKNGCILKDTINIVLDTVSRIKLSKDTVICDGEFFELKAIFPNGDYSWQNGKKDENYKIFEAGEYWVKVDNNCGIESDTVQVVLKDCRCHIYAPNVFSPNDDNVNDNFQLMTDCTFTEYHLFIYNRWGERVFESEDREEKWNGMLNNERLPNGVYVYYVVHDFDHNKKGVQSGSVTLIR